MAPGDELVIGDGSTLAAYDATGVQRWTQPQGSSQQIDALAITPSGTIVLPDSARLALYDADGTTAGERWFADADAHLTWAASAANGALAFTTSAGLIGLTEPID
jgi:outer membrane protein assembly factor BamB